MKKQVQYEATEVRRAIRCEPVEVRIVKAVAFLGLLAWLISAAI